MIPSVCYLLGSKLYSFTAGLNQAEAVLLQPSQLQIVPKALASRHIAPQRILEMYRRGPSAQPAVHASSVKLSVVGRGLFRIRSRCTLWHGLQTHTV